MTPETSHSRPRGGITRDSRYSHCEDIVGTAVIEEASLFEAVKNTNDIPNNNTTAYVCNSPPVYIFVYGIRSHIHTVTDKDSLVGYHSRDGGFFKALLKCGNLWGSVGISLS